MSGGWFRCPVTAWESVIEALVAADMEEWPAEVVAADLAWWADRLAVGAIQRIPGRPALRARWGWTDHRVRVALRTHFASASPAGRQPVASGHPVAVRAKADNGAETASPSPARRQPVASSSPHARIPTDNRQQTADTDKILSSPELDRVWSRYRELRKDAGGTPRRSPPKTWGVAARLAETDVGSVVAVIEWAHTSSHPRAKYLRAGGYLGRTLFQPSNFAEYLDMATTCQRAEKQVETDFWGPTEGSGGWIDGE